LNCKIYSPNFTSIIVNIVFIYIRCWINEEDMGRVWRIVVYIPIYIYLVVIIALYWKIIRSVRASLKVRYYILISHIDIIFTY
jgi:hypothetical protein